MTKMRVNANNGYINESPEDEIREGDVVNVRPYDDATYPLEFEHPRREGCWLCATPDELDEIEDEIVVGTRVRCINDSVYNGRRGTIDHIADVQHYPYSIIFDGGDGESGYWSRDAFEVITDDEESTHEQRVEALIDFYEDIIERKDAALTVAAFVFREYANQHFAKETPTSALKAITNIGLERTMLDALEAD